MVNSSDPYINDGYKVICLGFRACQMVSSSQPGSLKKFCKETYSDCNIWAFMVTMGFVGDAGEQPVAMIDEASPRSRGS